MNCKKIFTSSMMLVFGIELSVWGGVSATDFTSGSNTDQWDLSMTVDDGDKGIKFPDGDESITSPVYGGAAVSVSVSARIYGSNVDGSGSMLKIEARAPATEEWAEVHRLVFTGSSITNDTFSLSRGDDYRQFRLVFVKGNGTLRVRSFEVTWRADGEVAAPFSLKANEVTTNSFYATWRNEEPVDCFLFDCWKEYTTSWTGDVQWREDFAQCINEKGNPVNLTDEEGEFGEYGLDGWSGESVYLSAGCNGMIQVNKAADGVGWLITPELPPMENVELVIRARAYKMQNDHVMPVFIVRGGVTNKLHEFGLTEAFVDCHCPVAKILEGDRLAIKSFSVGSQRRVLLDSVAIVGGFEPGHLVADSVCDDVVVAYSDLPGFHVAGLDAECQYGFSVRAKSGGVESAASDVCMVYTTSSVNEPVLDAVMLSEISRIGEERIWREDFSAFTNVFPSSKNTAAWSNGVTLPHWQAYYGGQPVVEFSRNNGADTGKGLYAYWATNKVVDTYSLGTMTSGTADDFVYGLSFKNDMAFATRKISVRFEGVQFGFNNKEVQSLVCEYLVTNELVSVDSGGDWHSWEDLTYSTTRDFNSGLDSGRDLPVSTAISAELRNVDVPKNGYFMIRWKRSSATNSAAMAIDNVSVAFAVQPHPLTIVIR